MNINDLKYAVINVTGLSINDEYFVWLGVNGGTGNTLPDREFSYLISQGGIPGSINDMWLDLLRASGYEGSLNDMLWDFWNNGGDFTLPIVNLQNMGLVHDAAGGDLVSGRSSTATFTDYEGRVVDVLANENRFDGANRIHSLNNGNGTQTITVISGNDYQISIGSGSDNGATAVLSGGATGTLTADNVSRLSFANGTPKTVSTTSLTVTITGSIVELMVEDVTGKANQAPNNYIGNVIYNTGVAGVFYSAYESANTVDANGVVSEIQGALIFPAPTLLYEPQGINHCFPSDVPATQVITLAAADYTVWLDDTDGLGSIVLTGGATGTANSTDVNGFQFTASGAAITFTHSGSNNVRWQVEPGDHRTSYIPTTTVAVTRDADSPNLPLVVGTNFVQEQGMAIFRFKPGYNQFDNTVHYGLLGLKNSTASFLFDTATFSTPRVSSFDSSTELVSEAMGSGWLKDDDVIIVLTFSNSDSLYSINYSLDGGAVFGNWTDAAYDGSFELEGLLYRFFLQQAFHNELIATQVYGSLPGGTIADAKTWLEANAQTATGGAIELSALVTDAFDQLTTDNGSPLTVQE